MTLHQSPAVPCKAKMFLCCFFVPSEGSTLVRGMVKVKALVSTSPGRSLATSSPEKYSSTCRAGEEGEEEEEEEESHGVNTVTNSGLPIVSHQ